MENDNTIKNNKKVYIIMLLIVLVLGGMVIGVYLGQYQKHTEWTKFYEEIKPFCDLESVQASCPLAFDYESIFREELE